jgi:hypothetical protein
MQFHYCFLVHQGPLKYYTLCNGFDLMVFDGLSNDNEIILNVNHRQFINKKK